MREDGEKFIAGLGRTARDAADAAAAVHLAHAGAFTVETASEKATSDFVSEVDTLAQAAALAVIRDRHPHHRILAEEEEEEEEREGGAEEGGGPSAPLWIVDPLDGTTNYLHNHPMYCASVGATVDGVPVAGAVTAAATGERWWAHRGGGAWKCNPGTRARALSVAPTLDFTRALIGTGFPFKKLELLPAYMEQFARVLRATSGIRRGGSAALDLCYLAEGTFDGFWELWLSPWDVAAGAAILDEAGGRISRLDGAALEIEKPGSILAASSADFARRLGTLVSGADSDHP